LDIWTFIVEIEAITVSGALFPGPLTFATISQGAKGSWKSGILVSVGHMLVELPLIVVLAMGASLFIENVVFRGISAFLGGIVLIYLGASQFPKEIVFSTENSTKEIVIPQSQRSSIAVGVSLSALNPYFLLWWFTVGNKLIVDAILLLGVIGIPIMYILHVWMDYAFLGIIALLSFKGTRVFGRRGYGVILIVSSVILLFFGLRFLVDGVTTLLSLYFF